MSFSGVKPALARSGSQISSIDVVSSSSKYNKQVKSRRHRAIVDVIVSSEKPPSTTTISASAQSVKPSVQSNNLEPLKQHAKHLVDMEISSSIQEISSSWDSLAKSLQGAKLDTLIMLMATGAVIPLAKELGISPIIGFMLAGTVLGPNSLNWIKDVHMIDILGELGIVFFLFEMGLELSLSRLKKMRKDVFGLGTSQFLLSSCVGTLVALVCGLTPAAAVTIGGSLALSSSAFTLQVGKKIMLCVYIVCYMHGILYALYVYEYDPLTLLSPPPSSFPL